METKVHNTCVVCAESSEQVGLHYTRMLCNGCRAFFKRTVQGKVKIYECKLEGQCVVDRTTRKLCKACRYEACKRAGVDIKKVQPSKDDSTEESTMDRQFGHGININNVHTLPSSAGIQTAFQSYYCTLQEKHIPQNMGAMQSAISGHNPSTGVGLFKQNLLVNCGSHQMANPQAFNNSQLPAQCSVSNSPAQMWQHFATAGGGFLPTGYSAMEPSNRLAASSSVSVPYGNSLDIASSSTAESYPYMANYISQMGSRLFYNANAASSAPYAALTYADLFPQAASFSSARNSAATWHGLNRLDLNTLPTSLHDSVPVSQADSYSISNTRPGMLISLMNTVPISSYDPTKSNQHDTVGIYLRDTNNTQITSNDIKRELAYSCHNSGSLPNYQQVLSNSLGHVSSSPFGNDLQQSSAGQDLKQLTMDANCLPALSSSDRDTEMSGAHSSRRSSAFMIDTLLKPQQSVWSSEGKCAPSASGQYNALPQALSIFQGYKSTGETKESQYYNHGEFKVRILNRMKAESGNIGSLNFDFGNTSSNPNVTHGDNGSLRNTTCTLSNSVRHGESKLSSTPNHSDSESSLDDTLEDIDVYNTDEGIINELKSRCDSETEAFYQGTVKSDSVGDASKDELKELTRSKCCNDSACIETKEMASQINSSIRFNQSHGVSCGDSGLGRSSYVPSSGLHQTRPGSVEGVKAAEIEHGKLQYINKENAGATSLKKKRRLSVSDVSNNGISKKVKCNNHSFTATSEFRNCLKDISENYGENGNNQENSPRKLQIHLATNSDSSSEDEATTREAKLHPQFTSTPIGHAKNKKSRFFLEAICQFAKYCQIEATNPPEKDNCASATNSPSRSSPLKRPLSPARASEDSFDMVSRSESQSSKLERLDRFQRILMSKVQSLDTYTMAEFKVDAVKLNSLAQDAGRCRQLKF
ncbi:hypothetical protein BsWGS_23314 [Bradybaena similaris]